jgi:uncharacterized membrane protein YecN with MAPEG domain
MLPITLTIAAAAALINLWLAGRIIAVRMHAKVLTGDGAHPLLLARMRAQANFAEYAPFVLILLGLLEYARGSQGWLWAAGIVFILGRLVHPLGMDRPTRNALRGIGAGTTWLVLLALAIGAIYTVYTPK